MPSSPFVVSIDWDYFVGDGRTKMQVGGPCQICKWECDGNKGSNPKLRKEYLQRKATGFKYFRSITRAPVMGQFALPRWALAPLYVADCHATIYRLLPKGAYIYNIDYHEDEDITGEQHEPLTCATWGHLARLNKRCHYEWCYRHKIKETSYVDMQGVLHPNASDRFLVECRRRLTKPSMVFFCLSSPYVNPNYDKWFYFAVADLSYVMCTEPKFIGKGAKELMKKYQETVGQPRPRA